MPVGIYKRTKEHKEKISKTLKGRVFSQITINKMRLSKINDPFNYERLKIARSKKHTTTKGRPCLETTKAKLKILCSGFKHTPEAIEKIRKSSLGRLHSQETKLKQRLSAIKRIELNHGITYPSYNKNACEYFRQFDEVHNTKGRYAIYGNGEYKIKELGYWVDYINFDLKLIMEYDEQHHFINGNLREKDLQRQKEIQDFFLDFEFKRIKE